MSRPLVIVESPAKAKTIQKYLGPDFEVLASYGHVRDLVPKNGAVDPESDFAMTWEEDGRSVKVMREITAAVRDADKPRIVATMKMLSDLGFTIVASEGTQKHLAAHGIKSTKINKVLEGRPHIVDAIKNGEIQLVFNTTEGKQALMDSRSLRRTALLHKVPYYTTLAGAMAAAEGIKAYLGGDLEVRALQEYFAA